MGPFERQVETVYPRSMKVIDIGFLVSTGRVNLDVEQACMDAVGAESLQEFPRKLRAASDETIDRVWAIAKDTEAGRQLK